MRRDRIIKNHAQWLNNEKSWGLKRMPNWIHNGAEVAVRLWQVLVQPFLLGSNALQVQLRSDTSLPSCVLSDLIASRI